MIAGKIRGRVLVIAGSDSGGGAGIQADIKAITCLRGFAMTAITALTAQNTQGVYGIHAVPPEFVQRQIRVVLDDIGADAIKIGMLGSAPVIDAVCEVLEERAAGIPLVVDPVMVAKSGDHLLDPDAAATLKRRLLVLADVITPNLSEAMALSGMTIRDPDDMRHAADMLRTLGPKAVLLKGGHLEGGTLTDLLAMEEGERLFESPRIDTPHTHGTGCTLASALATGLAQGLDLAEAVARARAYTLEAIRAAPGFGHGHGPLDHGHTVHEF